MWKLTLFNGRLMDMEKSDEITTMDDEDRSDSTD